MLKTVTRVERRIRRKDVVKVEVQHTGKGGIGGK